MGKNIVIGVNGWGTEKKEIGGGGGAVTPTDIMNNTADSQTVTRAVVGNKVQFTATGGSGAVNSVNGKTGAVVLNANDIKMEALDTSQSINTALNSVKDTATNTATEVTKLPHSIISDDTRTKITTQGTVVHIDTTDIVGGSGGSDITKANKAELATTTTDWLNLSVDSGDDLSNKVLYFDDENNVSQNGISKFSTSDWTDIHQAFGGLSSQVVINFQNGNHIDAVDTFSGGTWYGISLQYIDDAKGESVEIFQVQFDSYDGEIKTFDGTSITLRQNNGEMTLFNTNFNNSCHNLLQLILNAFWYTMDKPAIQTIDFPDMINWLGDEPNGSTGFLGYEKDDYGIVTFYKQYLLRQGRAQAVDPNIRIINQQITQIVANGLTQVKGTIMCSTTGAIQPDSTLISLSLIDTPPFDISRVVSQTNGMSNHIGYHIFMDTQSKQLVVNCINPILANADFTLDISW